MRIAPCLLALAACATAVDGTLPAGTWGAEHYALTVEADGTARLEGDCAHGDLGPAEAVDGELSATFDWVSEAGPEPEPPQERASTPVSLTATVTSVRLQGVLAADDGAWSEDLDLRLDEEPVLYKCQ